MCSHDLAGVMMNSGRVVVPLVEIFGYPLHPEPRPPHRRFASEVFLLLFVANWEGGIYVHPLPISLEL